jgi:hypothetical protein
MIRFIYMLVAFVYSVGVTGLHVNLHWCSGQLASMNINTLEHAGCGCDDEEASDCCADAGFYVKVDNSHSAASGLVIPTLSQVALISLTYLDLRTVSTSKFEFRNFFQSVDLPPPDLLVKHCCYLI